jgi:hypothetical protein
VVRKPSPLFFSDLINEDERVLLRVFAVVEAEQAEED